jgi:hypothetical protein
VLASEAGVSLGLRGSSVSETDDAVADPTVKKCKGSWRKSENSAPLLHPICL